MKKITKGALSMVLVGAVTFSVMNVLFSEHSPIRLAKVNTITNSRDHKIADNFNHSDKTVKKQTPTTNVQNTQATLSHSSSTQHTVFENPNKSDKDTGVTQKKSTTYSRTPKNTITIALTSNTKTQSNTTTNRTTNIKSAVPTIPTTSTTKVTTATTATSTTTNHGQQVSQVTKDRVATHQNKKENNGKKKGIL